MQTFARSTERERFDDLRVPGVVSVGTADLSLLPVIGDGDIVRAASLLPGVSARNDFSAGLNVRGGEADQNLVLLDGIPIYNPFHLGGLFGTFIDAGVRQIDVFTGAFPAQYGGRLSSVLDVKSVEDPRPGLRTTADVSLLSSSVMINGATGDGRIFRGSVAGRRTYADRLVNAVVGSNDFPYHFQDLQLHGLATIPHGGTLALTAYAGLDELLAASGIQSALLPESGADSMAFDWSNRAVGILLTQPIGQHAMFQQRLSLSGFSTHFDVPARSHWCWRSSSANCASPATIQIAARAHSLTAGYDLSRYRTVYRERMSVYQGWAFDGDAASDADTTNRQSTSAAALFVEDMWRPNSRLQLRPGLRAEWVPAAGWSGISPRMSARYFVSKDLALTVAAGRYTQWMRAIRNEDLPVRVFDLWVPSDSSVPVSSSTHLVLGVERWFGSSRFLRLEAYGKSYQRLLEQASTIDPRIRPSALRQFDGHSYGVDFYARQLERRGFSGWLSYSYGVSTREFQGERYFPAHDRRHNANLAMSWAPAKNFTLGAHLAVASGNPYTGWAGYMQRWQYDPVTSQWTLGAAANDDDNVVRGQRNGDRLPLYSRFDLSAERRFRIGRAIVRPHLSIVNVFNHENVFLYTLDEAHNPPRVRAFTQFPLLPSLGVRAEF